MRASPAEIKIRVLKILATAREPLTAREVSERLGAPIGSVRPRLSELHRDRIIKPVGGRAPQGQAWIAWERVGGHHD